MPATARYVRLSALRLPFCDASSMSDSGLPIPLHMAPAASALVFMGLILSSSILAAN